MMIVLSIVSASLLEAKVGERIEAEDREEDTEKD